MKLTFVIPCYRSGENLDSVIDDIRIVTAKRSVDYEIILVNDCSPDDTWIKIRELSENDKKITGVNLARNTGQANALMAGFNLSTGDYVMTVEDDGQSSVELLWEMYELLDEEHDIVCARNITNPKRSFIRKLGAKINRGMLDYILDKPKDISPSIFFLAKKNVIEEMTRYKNPYTYIGGLILRSTSKIANYDVCRKDRISGTSNYNLKKLVFLFVNGLTAFSIKPLRVASVMGFCFSAGSIFFAIIKFVQHILFQNIVLGYTSLICIILFLGGCTLIVLGIIGEYLGRIYMCINNEPQYIIRQIITSERKNLPDVGKDKI